MDFDLFGGLFDFNGDGETDLAETLMDVHILSEMEDEEDGKS